jgi:hypothetical protein
MGTSRRQNIALKAIQFVNSVCTIFSLWKRYPPHQTFPSLPELTSVVSLWKQDPCAEPFTQWIDFTKFFNHRADVDCVDDHGWTTMHETILGKSIEVAEYLNKIRPKMKFKACQQGRTSLHLAAFCDSPKALLRYVISTYDQTLSGN